MAIKPYDPVNTLAYLRGQLNRLAEPGYFPSVFEEDSDIATSLWRPSVDVKEDDNNYIFLADLPGVNAKDIDVSVEDGALTIKGERKTESKEEKEGYRRIERSHGNFYRRFSLPDTADTGKVTAETNNGVLEIKIPKTVGKKAQKVKIRARAKS